MSREARTSPSVASRYPQEYDPRITRRVQVNAREPRSLHRRTADALTRATGSRDDSRIDPGEYEHYGAAESFRMQPRLRVLQISSERIPCPMLCGSMLRNYFRECLGTSFRPRGPPP